MTYVFPKASVFCPMTRKEQPLNVCALCPHFGAIATSTGGDKANAKSPPVFVVNCGYGP